MSAGIKNTFNLKANFANYEEEIYSPEFTGGQSSSPVVSFDWTLCSARFSGLMADSARNPWMNASA